MRIRSLLPLLLLLSVLSACGEATETKDQTPAGSDGGSKNASSGGSKESDEPTAEIVDSGFGQNEYTTQAMVIVTTDDEAAVGKFVTVSVNFLDADGQILSTADQVESFTWVGQELAMPVTPYEMDEKAKVASIEPSVSLSDHSGSEESMAPLPVLESTEVKKGEYGGMTASFAFTNESDEVLKDLRVGVVCYDKAKKIIGGNSTYPSLAPVGKTIRIDSDVTVSGNPQSCKAYLNYGY